MPFLVDSVTAAINDGGRDVRLVIHPILTVARDADGRLGELGGAATAGLARILDADRDHPRDRTAADLARLTPDSDPRPRRRARRGGGLAGDARRRSRGSAASCRAPPPPRAAGRDRRGRRFSALARRRQLHLSRLSRIRLRAARRAARGRRSASCATQTIRFSAGCATCAAAARRAGFRPPPRTADRHQIDRRATVHRTAHMDAIGIRRFDASGEVVGLRLFLGLFTSLAYSRSPRSIPLLRQKVRRIVERAGLRRRAMTARRCRTSSTPSRATSCSRSPRTAVRHRDRHPQPAGAAAHRAVCPPRPARTLCLLPRLCAARALRHRVARRASRRSSRRRLPGRCPTFYTHLDESVLARVQFIIRTTRGAVPPVDVAALERRLAEAGRSWSDRVEEAAGRVRRRPGARPAAPAASRSRSPTRRAPSPPRRSPICDASRRCWPARRSKPRCIPAATAAITRTCGSTARTSRWCCPTCCRSSKTSACASSPKSRSASTRDGARCGSTNSRSAARRCWPPPAPPRSAPRFEEALRGGVDGPDRE